MVRSSQGNGESFVSAPPVHRDGGQRGGASPGTSRFRRVSPRSDTVVRRSRSAVPVMPPRGTSRVLSGARLEPPGTIDERLPPIFSRKYVDTAPRHYTPF